MKKLSAVSCQLTARNRRGSVLILTFIIMITIEMITGAFLYMVSIQLKNSSYNLISAQALWLAEAGIQNVLYNLQNDSSYRLSPTTVTGNLGSGSYSVTVTKNNSTYTMTSTATVDVLNRKITQSVVATSNAFNYAIFANTNDLTIKDTVVISGDLYSNENVVVQAGASVINGLVYADSVSGPGTYTPAPGPPSPVPTYPPFDTSTYDAQIATAEAQATSNLTLTGASTLNLGGSTVYYKVVTVQDSAQVIGPGTIVATQHVTIQNSASLTSNTTVITKKNITMQNSAVISSGNLIYAREGISLQDSANAVAGNFIVPTVGQTIEMKGTTTMTGAVYTSIMRLQDSADVTGSVVANSFSGNHIQNSAHVTYDQSVLGSIPTGMEGGPVTLRVQKDWDEIVPAV